MPTSTSRWRTISHRPVCAKAEQPKPGVSAEGRSGADVNRAFNCQTVWDGHSGAVGQLAESDISVDANGDSDIDEPPVSGSGSGTGSGSAGWSMAITDTEELVLSDT